MAIYSYFVANGKNPTHNQEAAALEARHDNSIGTALMRLLDNSPMSSP
jgi:hypothetical protein